MQPFRSIDSLVMDSIMPIIGSKNLAGFQNGVFEVSHDSAEMIRESCSLISKMFLDQRKIV